MWTKHFSIDGKVYYFNAALCKSQWSPPSDGVVHEAPNAKPPPIISDSLEDGQIGISESLVSNSPQVETSGVGDIPLYGTGPVPQSMHGLPMSTVLPTTMFSPPGIPMIPLHNEVAPLYSDAILPHNSGSILIQEDSEASIQALKNQKA